MDLNKWTVIRLKDACTRRKVEVAGKKKADLVESLTTYLRENPSDELAPLVIEDMEEEEHEEETTAAKGDADGDAEESAEKEKEPEKIKEEKKETKKKEEKPAAKPKPFLPTIKEFSEDLRIDWQARAIVVAPIGMKEYNDPKIAEYMKNSERFFVRCAFNKEKEEHIGHLELRFRSRIECSVATKDLKEFNEDFTIKRVSGRESLMDKNLVSTPEDSEGEKRHLRTLVAYGIPSTTKEEQLTSVFTDVKRLIIGYSPDDKFKG